MDGMYGEIRAVQLPFGGYFRDAVVAACSALWECLPDLFFPDLGGTDSRRSDQDTTDQLGKALASHPKAWLDGVRPCSPNSGFSGRFADLNISNPATE
jgi:hypothetical protein